MNAMQLIAETERFVRDTFDNFPEHPLPYHNLEHTVQVVYHVKEIGGFYKLSEEHMTTLVIAAWFHDIGHLFGGMEEHEETGIIIMEGFMELKSDRQKMTPAIAECIRATKYPPRPSSLLHSIICDADTYHFGTPYFMETDPAIRTEIEMYTGAVDPDWHAKSLKLLESHIFFTDYCRDLLDAGKKENIAWLRSLT